MSWSRDALVKRGLTGFVAFAEDLESRLIAEFVRVYGQRPFTNRKAGRRRIAS